MKTPDESKVSPFEGSIKIKKTPKRGNYISVPNQSFWGITTILGDNRSFPATS